MQTELKHVENRILIKVWLEEKNHHTFSHGVTIRLERRYENFNCRETQPIQGTVVSGDGIEKGAIILFHHNGTRPEFEVLNHGQLSGKDIASDIKFFSVPEEDCFAWKMPDGEWQPTKTFDFALRVFAPYNGPIHGIEPTLIKDCLYMRTGDFAGQVVRTLKACDYEIVFREPNTGQEGRLIRCRPNGDERTEREPEVIAIDHGLTKKVNDGLVHVGLSKLDAKSLNEYINERVH